MLVVKKTGLVPVVSIKRGGNTSVHGVPPAIARAGLLAGELKLVPVPADIEVYEVGGPVEPKFEKVADDSGEDLIIPDDWEESHPLKRIVLAQKITGQAIVLSDEDKANDVKKSDLADAVIRAELQRRAAAEPPAE